jgi:hypothetical protein
MENTHIHALMHAVLDGEASEPQARELERALAADPAARARFEELKRLFVALEGVPEATPPADIVERILARTALARTTHSSPDQLFGFSRVRDAFGQLLTGGTRMSQPQNGNARRRNILIGIGLAAVGAALFGHYVLDIPNGGENLSGTVAPAQRYRSNEQVKPTDVRLGDQTVSQLVQNEDVDRLIKDPGFQALAADQAAMTAFAANAQAFAALSAQPAAFNAMSANPAAFAALASQPAAFAAIAANPSAFSAFAANPAAFAAAAANPSAAASSHPAAFAAMSANAAAFKALAADSAAMAALSANSQAFAAMAANAAAFKALAANAAAMSALSANAAAFNAMAANSAAFQALAANSQALAALSAFAAKPNAMASMSAMQANPSAFAASASAMSRSQQATAASSASASTAASASLQPPDGKR